MIWPGVPVVGPDRKQAPSRTKIIVSHVKLGLSTSTLGHCFYFGGTWIEAKTEPTAMILMLPVGSLTTPNSSIFIP